MSTKRKWLAALPAALILASITTFAVAQVAGSGGVGRLLVYLNGSQKYVDRVNFNGFTGVQDGGLLTLTASGGGSANNPTGCVQGAITIANTDGGDPTCNSNLNTIDNAGNITLPVGATIGTLDPRAAKTVIDNLPARVISSDEFKSGTQDFDYCFSVNITTTGGSPTVFYRIATPQASQLFVRWTCNATEADGGGAIVSAKYSREAAYVVPDGGSLPGLIGGIDTIGMDREQDTTWGGPNATTYDGGSNTGVVELNFQGVAGQTIDWNCSGCWKRTPRADSGIP